MIKHKRVLLIAGLLSVLSAVAARAGTIKVDYQGAAFPNYQSGQIKPSHLASRGHWLSVDAGEFSFKVLDDNTGLDWGNTLQAFCIDIDHWLVTGRATYNLVSASDVLNAQQLSLVSKLYGGHAQSLVDSTDSAAFQLALWEIMSETRSTLSLDGGHFRAKNFAAVGLTNTWLDTLSSQPTTSAYEFYALVPDDPSNNQELLVARPVPPKDVPEPASLALLGAGILGLGVMRRRRRAAQRT